MYPGVHSISVVPVGLTKYREKLFKLDPYDMEASSSVLSQIENHSRRFKEKYGSSIVYAADEFYALAGRAIPEYSEYEDFPQLENGVGMLSLFRHEFNETIKATPANRHEKERIVSVTTGMLAYEFISGCAKTLEKLYNGLRIEVYGINNDFFGDNVTVSGLVTGNDVIRQLSGKELGAELLIPANMLRAGEAVLLDDVTVEEIEKKLAVKVTPVRCSGEEFIRSVLSAGEGWQKCQNP
jgi:putative radical SAM enzyme (TIGR03279 family)